MWLKDKKIWIIGGSRGMGLELAKNLIKADAKVMISARQRPANLNKKTYQFLALDLSDEKHLTKLLNSIPPSLKDLDGMVYMPAVYEPAEIKDITKTELDTSLRVNCLAPTLLSITFAPLLQKRKGFLALCGSVAGDIGLPKGQPYSATKAYIKNFCQTMAVEFPYLTVQLITPGFVKTDLTAKNEFRMPFIMSAARAGQLIFKGIQSQRFLIAFPLRIKLLLCLWGLLPYRLKKFLWRNR